MGSIPKTSSGASEFTPDSYPPFPESMQPSIELQSISLAALQAKDNSEQARLLSVCKDKGFFYLDLSNTNAESLPHDAKLMAWATEPFFKQPLEEKKKFLVGRSMSPGSLFGYKPEGALKLDPKGTKRDGFEGCNWGKDDIMDIQGREVSEVPDVIMAPPSRALHSRYQSTSHETAMTVLSALAEALDLPPDTFDELHRLERPSQSHSRVLRYHPVDSTHSSDVLHPGHTDYGSVTLLFNWLGGLQIWSESNHGESFDNFIGSDPASENAKGAHWLWVKPKPDQVLVNLGDAAVKMTGGTLCAGRHRVLPAPGEQAQYTRYTVIYFLRTADDAVLKRVKGGAIPPLREDEVEEELTVKQWAAIQWEKSTGGDKKV